MNAEVNRRTVSRGSEKRVCGNWGEVILVTEWQRLGRTVFSCVVEGRSSE